MKEKLTKEKLMKEVSDLYYRDENTVHLEVGANVKILSVDVIKDNKYYKLNENVCNPDKIHLVNQITNKHLIVNLQDLTSFKVNKETLSFVINGKRVLFRFKNK